MVEAARSRKPNASQVRLLSTHPLAHERLYCIVLVPLCCLAICVYAQKPVVSRAESDVSGDASLATLRSDAPAAKSGVERDYLNGVIAARGRRDAEAIPLLGKSASLLRQAEPEEAAMAIRLLANVYDRERRYKDSNPLYRDLTGAGAIDKLPIEYRQGAREDAEVAQILASSPVQTIDWTGPVHLNTTRNNVFHLLAAELLVSGVKSQWLLDTGANQSVVSESLARQLHLAILPGVAHTKGGLTGIQSALHVALLPELPLGGATLHNVPVLVMADADLTVSDGAGTRTSSAASWGSRSCVRSAE